MLHYTLRERSDARFSLILLAKLSESFMPSVGGRVCTQAQSPRGGGRGGADTVNRHDPG